MRDQDLQKQVETSHFPFQTPLQSKLEFAIIFILGAMNNLFHMTRYVSSTDNTSTDCCFETCQYTVSRVSVVKNYANATRILILLLFKDKI